MSWPTLDELLSSPDPLPAESHPYYNDKTVSGDVKPCGAEDKKIRRIFINPNNSSIYTPLLQDLLPNPTVLNLDDSSYRKVMTQKNGFIYRAENSQGQPAGLGVLALCRSDTPVGTPKGGYEVYITDKVVPFIPAMSNEDILDNAPRQPNFLDQLIGIRLSDQEIINLVRGSGMLDRSQYAVSQDSKGLFYVTHNRKLANGLADWMESDPKARELFPSESRRKEIADAIRSNVDTENFQFMGIEWSATWQPIVAGIGSVAALASIGGLVYMAKLMRQQMKLMADTMRGGLQTGESALEKYGRDVTRLAREEKLPPVLGREEEMKQLTNVLGKRQVANPLLVGPPGSGKSAIVEGFAQKLVRGEIKGFDPAKTRVVEISQEALKAEAGIVGTYEARIRAIMQEVGLKMTDKGEIVSSLKPGERIILFIDEIHNANREPAKGVSSLMAQLKPYTSRGDISVVGATTNEEVHILTSPDGRQDSATGRRFDIVNISAMSADQSLDLLIRNRATYENGDIQIKDSAFREAVVLTDNFKPQQHFPDKSIQLIDLVVSTARNEGITEVTPEYVRRVFSTSSGLTEDAMVLELQLRTEEAGAREERMSELRDTSATEYLRSRNIEEARLPAAVQEASRLWETVSESEKGVYISHEADYKEGTIPTRFLEKNLAQLKIATSSPQGPVTQAPVNFEKFLDSIGLDKAERENLQPGELAKAVVLRLSVTKSHPAVQQELTLLNAFMDRNPGLFPDRDELVRLMMTDRLAEAASKDRPVRSTAEVVSEYAEKKNLEENARRALGEAAKVIDRSLEKTRKEDKERRERERK